MKKLQSTISKLALTIIVVCAFTGINNNLKAQFTNSTFMVYNTSPCQVDVFFEFQSVCGGPWTCCTGGFWVTVGPTTGAVPVAVPVSGDALIRVYPYGYGCGTAACLYYFGDFSTAPANTCYSPSVGPGTTVSGDDCNGNPNALNAVVNTGCSNCITIF